MPQERDLGATLGGVDFERGELRLADWKTGSRTVPLSPPPDASCGCGGGHAVAQTRGPWVFLGGKPGTRLWDVGRPWRKLPARAHLAEDSVRETAARVTARIGKDILSARAAGGPHPIAGMISKGYIVPSVLEKADYRCEIPHLTEVSSGRDQQRDRQVPRMAEFESRIGRRAGSGSIPAAFGLPRSCRRRHQSVRSRYSMRPAGAG